LYNSTMDTAFNTNDYILQRVTGVNASNGVVKTVTASFLCKGTTETVQITVAKEVFDTVRGASAALERHKREGRNGDKTSDRNENPNGNTQFEPNINQESGKHVSDESSSSKNKTPEEPLPTILTLDSTR